MEPSFASASGTGSDLGELLGEISARARSALEGKEPPDLAILFLTPDFGAEGVEAGPRVKRLTGARHLLGCTGAGVIGSEAEREGGNAAALLLVRIPGTEFRPFHVSSGEAIGREDPDAFRRTVGVPADVHSVFLLLADPFSLDPDALLGSFNAAWPNGPVLGGLASGGNRPGAHTLWLDQRMHGEGAVGVAMSGGRLRMRALVSQGCRPIGRRFVVTRAEGHRIFTLAGKPSAEALRETLETLVPEDRTLARTSLHIGRVAQEARDDFARGDFLIRNLVAVVPEDGSLVVADHVRVGQTVQFQLRDASTAREDLTEMLELDATLGPPGAGLVFSCGGRGSHLFGEPDHDLNLLRNHLGEFPLAGFFCNGEFGPVGTVNCLHGFTTSMAFFT